VKIYHIHYQQIDAVTQWLLDNNVKQESNPLQYLSGVASGNSSRPLRMVRIWTSEKNSKPSGYYVNIEDPNLMAMFVLAFSEYIKAYDL